MADIIQIRRDTAANWTSVNPILAQGELGVETDTHKFKIGDGTTAWATLVYLIDVGNYLTASSTNTLTNKTIQSGIFTGDSLITNASTTVYNLTGTALDPSNGNIQYKTISANTTFTDSFNTGESIILRLASASSYTITWPTMTWFKSGGSAAPTLTASDAIVLWKEGTTLYGAYAGSGV